MIGTLHRVSYVAGALLKRKPVWDSNIIFRAFSAAKDIKGHQAVKTEQPEVQQAEVVTVGAYKIEDNALTPHQLWLTQGKGMERPYTGDYWDNKDLGHYECIVCSNKLFLSDHQFQAPTGMVSFWNHVTNSVDVRGDTEGIKEDKENLILEKYINISASMRVCCSKDCFTLTGLLPLSSDILSILPWLQPPEYYKAQKLAQKNKQGAESTDSADDIIDKPALNKEKLQQLEEESQRNFDILQKTKSSNK